MAFLTCKAGEVDRAAEFLFADPFAIEVLVEEADFGDPASDRPNRFFAGWIPIQVEGRRVFRSSHRASLRFAALTPSARQIHLDVVNLAELGAGGELEARIDGSVLFRAPIADPLTIPVPGDLAPGPHLLEISSASRGGLHLVVSGARFSPSRAPGDAKILGSELVQSGLSLVDVVARPGPGRRLGGEFCPGRAFEDGQRFSVEVASDAALPPVRWSWGGSFLDRLRKCARFQLPIPNVDAPVRVRFASEGSGPAARWRRVSLSGDGSELANHEPPGES